MRRKVVMEEEVTIIKMITKMVTMTEVAAAAAVVSMWGAITTKTKITMVMVAITILLQGTEARVSGYLPPREPTL